MEWNKVSDILPGRGIVVETKIDDEKGLRNEQKLKLIDNLWYTADGGMYVYYTPTHWKPISLQEQR